MRMLMMGLLAGSLALTGCQSGRTAHPLPDACFQAPDTGRCRAAMPRYYYDADADRCEQFTWGGCEGSVPFETLDACMAACYAPAPDLQGDSQEGDGQGSDMP
ncbi:BPTI/Kunitz domain-containing protein [Alloalcanivorax marinus]|uniref:BPTI/Kunitz domain-containing protein n=1 Tax=Alloalcanivorax marinus TaxID=1177169 RepID=UPI0021D236CC|nr:BPTI/Kunitz domain-containing protein [Alloalcanivorax marinus]MCU5786782.1 hypothetical protein [Alloalcanivorax marinus]